MRKPQIQPALASLSETDREQLADWLRHGDYDDVLARVNQPRPEGLGLHISKKPLQTFYAKVALLDLINARLPAGKKLTLQVFESLAQPDILLLSTADPSKIAEIHDAILATVHHLAKSGDNTPTQLLSLQRLADFPARAALREQIAGIQAERLQLQREREDRLKAMQAHKVAMDLRREERAERRENRSDETNVRRARRDNEQNARAHKHLELSGKRLRLSMKSLALRRKQHRDRIARLNRTTRDTELTEQCDALGPYARNLEEIRERARKHFRITPEESARRAELRKAWISQNAENSSPEGTPDDSPATSVPGNLATIDSVPERRLNSSMAESISPRPTISDSQFSIPNSQSAPSPINQSSIIPNQLTLTNLKPYPNP